MEKTFLLYLSVHWGDVIEQIKKICHIHFKPVEHMNRSEIWSNIKRELLGLKWVGNTTRQLTPKREPWLHVGRGLFGVHLLTLHFNVVWFIILTILSLLYSSSWAEFFLTCSKLISAKWPQVAQAHKCTQINYETVETWGFVWKKTAVLLSLKIRSMAKNKNPPRFL